MVGFSTLDILVRTGDGRHMVVVEPFAFTRPNGQQVTVLAGATTDGVSSPHGSWNICPPFGMYWLAGVLHDACYHAETSPIITAQEEADLIFAEALEALGVDSMMRTTLHQAVRRFGDKAWHAGHARKVSP